MTVTEPSNAAPSPWTPPLRVAFRVAFCFFIQFMLGFGNATLWRAIPGLGKKLEVFLNKPYLLAGQALAKNVFHLHTAGATIHPTGYSDRLLDWFAAGIMFAITIIATILWSAFARRTEYTTLWTWLRFALRLSIAVAMINYGSWKIFPIQMPPPSLAVLNEPMGHMAPMTFLWSLLGLSMGYERLTGLLELTGGFLLLYRRTALLGALLSMFNLGNILAFNLFFDVPVKLYASCLIAMTLLVILPDLRALFNFFWQHQPAAPRAAQAPTLPGRYRYLILALELGVLLNVGLHATFEHYRQYAREQANILHPSPFVGIWHIDSATQPLPSGYGATVTDLIFEPNGRLNLRAADGSLWGGSTYVTGSTTVLLSAYGVPSHAYHLAQPDASHLVLTNGDADTLQLTRVPLPEHYPLLERGFHIPNEWGLQR